MLNLTRELARRGHELSLVYQTAGTMQPAYSQATVDQIQLSLPGFTRRRLDRTASSIMQIGLLSRKRKIDAILSSHLGFIPFAAWVNLAFGTKFLFHLGLRNTQTKTKTRGRFIYTRVAGGVAPSHHTARSWLQAGWPRKTLHVVPNWVDSARFRPTNDRAQLRNSLKMKQDCAYIVYVGRVVEQKGVTQLLEAFGRLAKDHPNVRLLLVGGVDPHYQPTLDGLLSRLNASIRTRIESRPFTDRPEDYLAASDLACSTPVIDEAFGLTIIEAMACGVPIITTPVGIIPKIIGAENTDLLVKIGDSSDFVDCLRRWLEHPDAIIKRGRKLRERALAKYSPSASVDHYEQLLNAIARSDQQPKNAVVDEQASDTVDTLWS